MPEMNFSLWDFSLKVYARPGVASTCLDLQDTYGVDVNVLLWCLWLEQQQKKLDIEQLQEALHLVSDWVEFRIKPLRKIRRELTQPSDATDSLIETLRRTIKQAELLAEQHEQWLLQSLAINWSKERSFIAPGTNLRIYLTALHIPENIQGIYLESLREAIKT